MFLMFLVDLLEKRKPAPHQKLEKKREPPLPKDCSIFL